MSTETKAVFKTYVLSDRLDSDVPIFQRVAGDQRVRVKKMPFYRPYLRVTYQDENGVGHTIRYKANATDADGNCIIDQRQQIDKLKIDANDPFSAAERRDLYFRNGVLVTNKTITQVYLESYPGCEGFKGTCDDVPLNEFKLLNKEAESKIKNIDMRQRVKAANKVIDLNLEEAKSMLIRLNGSFFETPKPEDYGGTEEERIEAARQECQNMLMEFIDDAEEGGLLAVLKEDTDITVDEKTTVLIGKLISAGLLSFDAVEGKISKKGKDNKWIQIREMSNEYPLEERKRLFSDFLNTDDGKLLKNDLEKDLKGIGKKSLVTA